MFAVGGVTREQAAKPTAVLSQSNQLLVGRRKRAEGRRSTTKQFGY
jgi:hypothetical protein